MKIRFIRVTIEAYFLTDTLKWQGKDKYLLNSLHGKLENKVSLKQM